MQRPKLLVLAIVATGLAAAGPAAAGMNDKDANSTHAVFVQTNRASGNTEPPRIFRRENQLRSFLFWKERGNGDGEAAQVVYA